jgi:hypothetical protein
MKGLTERKRNKTKDVVKQTSQFALEVAGREHRKGPRARRLGIYGHVRGPTGDDTRFLVKTVVVVLCFRLLIGTSLLGEKNDGRAPRPALVQLRVLLLRATASRKDAGTEKSARRKGTGQTGCHLVVV